MAFYQLSEIDAKSDGARAVFTVYGAGIGPKNHGAAAAILRADFTEVMGAKEVREEISHLQISLQTAFSYEKARLNAQIKEFEKAAKELEAIDNDFLQDRIEEERRLKEERRPLRRLGKFLFG